MVGSVRLQSVPCGVETLAVGYGFWDGVVVVVCVCLVVVVCVCWGGGGF